MNLRVHMWFESRFNWRKWWVCARIEEEERWDEMVIYGIFCKDVGDEAWSANVVWIDGSIEGSGGIF